VFNQRPVAELGLLKGSALQVGTAWPGARSRYLIELLGANGRQQRWPAGNAGAHSRGSHRSVFPKRDNQVEAVTIRLDVADLALRLGGGHPAASGCTIEDLEGESAR
jgi:hypothetical protein